MFGGFKRQSETTSNIKREAEIEKQKKTLSHEMRISCKNYTWSL